VSAIEIARVAGLATVQDGGRPGHMHEGVPPGGAIVPELLARANAAVGNAPSAAAIEVFGAMAIVARGDVVVATDEGVPTRLHDGERLDVPAAAELRVRYVTVRAAFAVPSLLGGRGTLLAARFGGFEGRLLRRGDVVPVGDDVVGDASAVTAAPLDLASPIRIVLGPDLARFDAGAGLVLTSSVFHLTPSSNRTGARLTGPALARCDADGGASAPMVAGAIEVPASGEPIVLGPDHPTTGGYPVIATIVRADLGRFHARRPGAPVVFRPVSSTLPAP
jgi:biotin-dependent carboxylase-like uncharacterized protein